MAFTIRSNTAQQPGHNKSIGHNLIDNNGRGQSREMPFCTHSNYHGHTVDTCYKIHGYPPGFRQKPKIFQNPFTVVVVQVSDQNDAEIKSEGGASQLESFFFFQNLNSSQCQQLVTLLTSQLSSVSKPSDHSDQSSSFTAGICLSINLNSSLLSPSLWLIDSGASRHICSNIYAFVSIKSIHNTIVTLPDHTSIPIHFCGDVRINSALLLKDVLFIPQFKFNLISVSFLTLTSPLTVHFFPDQFVIQDLPCKKMIGKGNRVEDLYVLDVNNSVSSSVHVNSVSHSTSLQLWHNRLGHLFDKCLDIMKGQLQCNHLSRVTLCYIFPLAKQK